MAAGDQTDLRAVIDFWFEPATVERWFTPDPAFDQLCRERFGPLVDRAAAGELSACETTAEGCLGLCILLDQLPRNIFRGTARAFATDGRAVAVAIRAIEQGFDRALPPDRRAFLYLPLMHSERLADQDRAVALYRELGNDVGLKYALEHAEIIRRFGRFPHRNAILGRTSTAAELDFLQHHGDSYGQSASTEGWSSQPRASAQKAPSAQGSSI